MEKNAGTKKKFGVQAKLLIFILPLVAVGFFSLVMMAYMESKTTIAEKTESLMKAEGKAGVQQIKAWESGVISTLDTAAETMIQMGMDDQELLKYEEQFLGTYEEFPNGVYITYEDGKVVDASGWEPEGDVTTGTWYLEGKNHKTFAFGEPYIDAYTNEYVVTASRWIDSLNGKGAVVAADVSLSILAEVVSGMEVVGDGDAFILDGTSGTILAHIDTELVGLTVSECEDY